MTVPMARFTPRVYHMQVIEQEPTRTFKITEDVEVFRPRALVDRPGSDDS